MNYIPTHNQVLIERLDYEAKTAGGIVLPNKATSNGPLQRGKVLAVGPGWWTGAEPRYRMPVCCAVGDTILSKPVNMVIVDPSDSRVALLPDSDVVCIVQP